MLHKGRNAVLGKDNACMAMMIFELGLKFF